MTLTLLLAAALPISDRPQMLWDDYLVDTNRTTAVLTPHQAECVGTVLTFDRRWEGDGCDFNNIIVDEDEKGRLYRMYYLAWHLSWHVPGKPGSDKFAPGRRVCYLESRDGITWTRPELGICEFEGSKKNNIIADAATPGLSGRPVDLWDNFIVVKDDRPECPPEERYKATGLTLQWNAQRNDYDNPGLGCWISADGIHFKFGWKHEGLDPAHGIWGDSMNVTFWDAATSTWNFYGRTSHKERPDQDCEGLDGVRDIMHSRSPDFRHWSSFNRLDFGADAEDMGFYINNIEPYYRDPALLVGFPVRYVERLKWSPNFERLCGLASRRVRAGEGHKHRFGRAITDCVFMFSREGGNRFHRVDDAFMRPGPEHERNWIYGDCYPAYRMILSPGRQGDDQEISFFAQIGHFSGRAPEMQRHVMRIDGFLSYHAKYNRRQPYRLVTKPLVFKGGEFRMNFSTSARGGVYVTLRGEDGKSITSCEQFGDKVDRVVDFDGKVSDFAGKPCVVEFLMSDADIYSFQVR